MTEYVSLNNLYFLEGSVTGTDQKPQEGDEPTIQERIDHLPYGPVKVAKAFASQVDVPEGHTEDDWVLYYDDDGNFCDDIPESKNCLERYVETWPELSADVEILTDEDDVLILNGEELGRPDVEYRSLPFAYCYSSAEAFVNSDEGAWRIPHRFLTPVSDAEHDDWLRRHPQYRAMGIPESVDVH